MKECAARGIIHVVSCALLALLITTLFISAEVARAEDSEVDVSDAESVVTALAPEVMGETAESTSLEEAADRGEDAFTTVSSGDFGEDVVVVEAKPVDEIQASLYFSIDYVEGEVESDGGMYTAAGELGVYAHVQPTRDGVRVMTAVPSVEAGSIFSYTFDGGVDWELREVPGGFTILADSDGDYIATLEKAWAVDAAGNHLPTSYTWEDGKLEQSVTYSSDTVFPVLLDPAWSYDFDRSARSIRNLGLTYPKADAYRHVDRALRACFNCNFPIAGAPRSYPVSGQVISLNAAPWAQAGIEAARVPAPVRVSFVNQGAMKFTAQAGHFDGQGSTIIFSWYNDSQGYLHLFVKANVVKDLGGLLNSINASVAKDQWTKFLINVLRSAKP